MPRYQKDINAIYISERMQENLRHIKESTMTSIVAPMGYGKTTAALWYLNEQQRKGDAVFRVNIYSSDVNLFWQSFCSAFRGTELGERLSGMDFPIGQTAVHMLIQDMMDYLNTLEKDMFLLIDDCHLMEDSRVFSMLFSLCDIPTRKLHMIVVSRSVVFMRGEELHLGNKLHRITVDDMRLNRTELSAYLRRCGIDLSEDDFETLFLNSEGWFSCVYLNLRNYEKNGTLLSKGEDIYSMIGETLYAGYQESEQRFLIDLCIADEFSIKQAAFITERDDTRAIIKSLAQNNAFIRYLPDTDTFRFHHMLRGYVERLFGQLPDRQQRDLKIRYGQWYESQKQYHQAIIFLGQAEDRRSALRVIGLDRATQLSAIAPEWTLALLKNCTEEEMVAEPQGLLVLMRRLFSWQQIPKMLELKELVLKAAKQPERTEDERNNLLGDCDLMMSFLRYNDISAMSHFHRSACQRMTRSSICIQKEGPFTFGSPSVLLMFHRESGKLDHEICEMNQCMPHYYQVTDGHGMGAEQIMEAEAFYNRGQFVDAHIMLEHARASAAEKRQHYILLCCDFLALRMNYCGKLPLQENGYEERMEQFKKLHDPILFNVLDGCFAYAYALSGDGEKIPKWIREGRLSEANLLNPSRSMFEIIYNQVLLLQKQYATVLGRGNILLRACQAIPYLLCEIHLHIQLAAASYALGRQEAAVTELKTALDQAMPDDILMPFAENGQFLMPILKHLPTQYADAVEKISDLYEEIAKTQIPDDSLLSSLTDREAMIARLAAAGMNRKEISQELFLSENTVRNNLTRIFDKLNITGTPKQKQLMLAKLISVERT